MWNINEKFPSLPFWFKKSRWATNGADLLHHRGEERQRWGVRTKWGNNSKKCTKILWFWRRLLLTTIALVPCSTSPANVFASTLCSLCKVKAYKLFYACKKITTFVKKNIPSWSLTSAVWKHNLFHWCCCFCPQGIFAADREWFQRGQSSNMLININKFLTYIELVLML